MANSIFDLTGKVALITGGNSGIGLAFAESLAGAGADVCIWGRREEKNQAAEEKLNQYGVRVLAQRCDVGEPDQVKECFAKLVETLGRVDSCFANAGIGGRGTAFVDMGVEEWRSIFKVNMEGVVFTFQEAIRNMMAHGGGGSLVVTSSIAAHFGAPRSQHYSATKAGVNAMVRSLAVEHARHGIRANAIVPGWIDTPMTVNSIHTEKMEKAVLRRIPLRRWGVPSDFGGLAVYLASDASGYHTGDVMVIDGGYAAF